MGFRTRARRPTQDEPAPLSVSGDARIAGAVAFPTGLTTHGDLVIAQGARVEGNLQVGGTLTLEGGVHLAGDARVEGAAVLHPGAVIEGALVCRRVVMPGTASRAVPVQKARESARAIEP